MNHIRLTILFVSVLLFSACGNSNNSSKEKEEEIAAQEKAQSQYIGKWVHSAMTMNSMYGCILEIEEDGEFLAVTHTKWDLGSNFLGSTENFLGTIVNGALDINHQHYGDIKYSEKNDVLYFRGMTFKKKKEEENNEN